MGQLGNGTDSEMSSRAPTEVLWLDDVSHISSADAQTCAVSNGDVWCWGSNEGGLVAPSSTPYFNRPIEQPDIEDASTVDVFAGRACAALANGEVACWGGEPSGDLRLISQLEDLVEQVAVGSTFQCALLGSGQIVCWGQLPIAGTFGRGLGDELNLNTLPLIGNARQLEAGAEHLCARTGEGTVHCMGQNRDGQLGVPDIESLNAPTKIDGLRGVIDISTGNDHTCAVNEPGEVFCWGLNRDGQLGDGTTRTRYKPTKVSGLPATRSVSAGAHGTCAVVDSGDLFCWGRDFGVNPRPIQF